MWCHVGLVIWRAQRGSFLETARLAEVLLESLEGLRWGNMQWGGSLSQAATLGYRKHTCYHIWSRWTCYSQCSTCFGPMFFFLTKHAWWLLCVGLNLQNAVFQFSNYCFANLVGMYVHRVFWASRVVLKTSDIWTIIKVTLLSKNNNKSYDTKVIYFLILIASKKPSCLPGGSRNWD